MFRDKIRIKLKAGNGGHGRVAFGGYHMPMGGTGGDGGDVYIQGSSDKYDFASLMTEFTYAAEDGEAGGVKNLTGRKGKDYVLKVPLTTKIYDAEHKLVLTIDKPNEPKLLLRGGQGGLGNWYFRTGGVGALEVSTQGKPGERLNSTFILELQSDVIFIGLPNAGKSSILNEITNAEAKVAAYAFTTLSPHLGRMNNITLMDLPGLIEKTSEGKGLGTSFVKHTKSAKLVAHFVSLESKDPVADYKLIRDELKDISSQLFEKPEVIILTKTDLISKEEVAAKLKLFKKFKKPLATVSAYDLDALEGLKQLFTQQLSTN